MVFERSDERSDERLEIPVREAYSDPRLAVRPLEVAEL
jgi:hypothetical protein